MTFRRQSRTRPAGLGRSRRESVSFLSKNRRLRLDGFPIEEVVVTGPRVDLGIADIAVETAGTLVLTFLSCRGVIHPATGAGELFSRPYAVSHPAAAFQGTGKRILRIDLLIHTKQCKGRELTEDCDARISPGGQVKIPLTLTFRGTARIAGRLCPLMTQI